jgi:hypothetical protein
VAAVDGEDMPSRSELDAHDIGVSCAVVSP